MLDCFFLIFIIARNENEDKVDTLRYPYFLIDREYRNFVFVLLRNLPIKAFNTEPFSDFHMRKTMRFLTID